MVGSVAGFGPGPGSGPGIGIGAEGTTVQRRSNPPGAAAARRSDSLCSMARASAPRRRACRWRSRGL